MIKCSVIQSGKLGEYELKDFVIWCNRSSSLSLCFSGFFLQCLNVLSGREIQCQEQAVPWAAHKYVQWKQQEVLQKLTQLVRCTQFKTCLQTDLTSFVFFPSIRWIPSSSWLLFPGFISNKSICPSILGATFTRQHIHNVCWSSCSTLSGWRE